MGGSGVFSPVLKDTSALCWANKGVPEEKIKKENQAQNETSNSKNGANGNQTNESASPGTLSEVALVNLR